MTLRHHRLSLLLDEVSDFFASVDPRKIESVRGVRTNCSRASILEKLESLKEEFPGLNIKTENRDADGKSSGSGSDGSGGGTIKPPTPGPRRGPLPRTPDRLPRTPSSADSSPLPAATPTLPEIRTEIDSDPEDDLYEALGNELEGGKTNGLDPRTQAPTVPTRGAADASSRDADAYDGCDVKSTPWKDTPPGKAAAGALYSGPLQKKQKAKGLKAVLGGFKSRFCVLRDGVLLVYGSVNDKSGPKEVVDLTGCNVKETSADKFSFKVIGINVEHEFNAEKKEDLMNWMNNIQTMSSAISAVIEPESDSSSDSEFDEVDETAHEGHAHSGSGSSTRTTRPRSVGPSGASDSRIIADKENVDPKEKEAEYTLAFLCRWDYNAGKPMQISAKAGDVIDVLNKDYDGFGWWTVQFKGRVGLFPKDWLTPAYERVVID